MFTLTNKPNPMKSVVMLSHSITLHQQNSFPLPDTYLKLRQIQFPGNKLLNSLFHNTQQFAEFQIDRNRNLLV
jgi:hypothetical protein